MSLSQIRNKLRKLNRFKSLYMPFFIVILIYIPLRFILAELDEKSRAPRLFQYEHREEDGALPGEVYFSDRSNGWALQDEHYRMMFDGTNTWKIKLPLKPGIHNYRYVLHFPAENTLRFATDSNKLSSRLFNDKMPRSEIRVQSIRPLCEWVDRIFHILIIGIPLFFPLSFWLIRFMRFRMSLRYKLIVSFLFLLIASNAIAIILNKPQNENVARILQTDTINFIHTMLISEGIEFSELETNPVMQNRISERLDRFFQNTLIRENYETFANDNLQITRVSVLGMDGQILVNVWGKELEELLRISYPGDSDIKDYYEALAGRVFLAYKKRPEFNQTIFGFSIFDYFTDEIRGETDKKRIQQYRNMTSHFQENGYIAPILHHQKVCGYYFFEIDGESISGLFRNNIYYSLVLLAVFAILCFFLISRSMGIMLHPVLSLINGLDLVREGQLDYKIEVDTHDEIEALGDAYNFMRKRIQESADQIEYYTSHLELELDKRWRELSRANAAYREELYIAGRLQQQLLDLSAFLQIKNPEIRVIYSALTEVGGDFYIVSEPRNSCVRIFLADVTGHGVPAALITMILKSEYEKVKSLYDPVLLLNIINDAFAATYGTICVFFTCIVIDIDTAEMKLRYVSAGHPSQYLLRNGECVPLHSKGRIIGVVANPGFSIEEITLNEGDRILLFTDGLLEQTNPQGEEYGEARLIDFLRKASGQLNCDELNAAVLGDMKDFQQDQEPVDDITLISVRCPVKSRMGKV
ncbi:MAG: SpoIIE family protein phosphatase [Spirochaetota bacterium]|jgi:serine phosphatase RsbU (regulator of sigma subunit)|nr:SpoIIE family protein phosphatase [Spirochaetota bacterium]